MKVLWLVSITIPAAADARGLQAKEIGGGWLSGALGGMTAAPDAPAITVASVDARAETLTVCSKNGVSFALVPTGSVENFSALLKKIVPDLVHIWGTEYAAARTMQQAAQAAGVPVLVGIQGVMVDCALHLNAGVPARLLHSCAVQHLIDRYVPGGLLDVNQARFDTLAQSEAAVLVNAVIKDNCPYGGAVIASGILFYCIQLYCDFSGGIDITRGVARLFGIDMAENFRRPIFATSLTDYWRRWHITLGAWMRDYVFYPISLSRGFGKLSRWARTHIGGTAGKIFTSAGPVIVYGISASVSYGLILAVFGLV